MMNTPRRSAGGSPRADPAIRPFRPEDKPGVVRIIQSVYDDFNYILDFDVICEKIGEDSYDCVRESEEICPVDAISFSEGD